MHISLSTNGSSPSIHKIPVESKNGILLNISDGTFIQSSPSVFLKPHSFTIVDTELEKEPLIPEVNEIQWVPLYPSKSVPLHRNVTETGAVPSSLNFIFPLTSNFSCGLVVPIPAFPEEEAR